MFVVQQLLGIYLLAMNEIHEKFSFTYTEAITGNKQTVFFPFSRLFGNFENGPAYLINAVIDSRLKQGKRFDK